MGFDTKRTEAVGALIARGFLAGGALRMEDAQKARELAPLLDELARFLGTARLARRRRPPLLVDAAAGKAALGVLAAALVGGGRLEVVALERVPERRARAESAARVLGVDARVRFVDADVADAAAWPAETPDVVVALHACGAATDTVLDVAMQRQAPVILAVPCCYAAAGGARHDQAAADDDDDDADGGRSVPGQAAAAALAAALPLPEHGLVGRRFAQSIVDAERTLRLEKNGWETEVVEVFPPTLSPYNLLWRARRVGEPVRMQRAAEKHARLVAAGV